MYGGTMFPQKTALDETPLEKLKIHPGSIADTSNAAQQDKNQSKRESLCNFNEPPVKARPM